MDGFAELSTVFVRVFITYLKLFSKLNMRADVANVLPKDSSVNPLNVLMERLWERLNL